MNAWSDKIARRVAPAFDPTDHIQKAVFIMDPKYYSLVEIVVFAVAALGLCIYQIWSVRRKSDEPEAPPDDTAKPSDSEGKT